MSMSRIYKLFPTILLLATACQDVEGDKDDHDHDHEQEVVTTVVLTFTPTGGGGELVFEWADPEDDGSPVIDEIVLSDAEDYSLTVSFLNELEDPAEDITAEVEDESDQHQVFFTGSGVEGPATGTNAAAILTHAYADTDVNGLPVGLDNDIGTRAVGSGELTVTLRHMPLESDQPVKVAGTAEEVAAGGF